MELIEIMTALSAQIGEHETALQKAEKHSNDHAYHQGQIHKLSIARQNIKDAASAATRFADQPQD